MCYINLHWDHCCFNKNRLINVGSQWVTFKRDHIKWGGKAVGLHPHAGSSPHKSASRQLCHL